MDEHRFAGIESDARGHRALCTCGWRSQRFSTAGLAGSVWDEHQVAPGDPVPRAAERLNVSRRD